jgi:hypothetical protein
VRDVAEVGDPSTLARESTEKYDEEHGQPAGN